MKTIRVGSEKGRDFDVLVTVFPASRQPRKAAPLIELCGCDTTKYSRWTEIPLMPQRVKGKSNSRPLCQDTLAHSDCTSQGRRARESVRGQQLGWSFVIGHSGLSSSGDMIILFPLLQRDWRRLPGSIEPNYPFGDVATQYIDSTKFSKNVICMKGEKQPLFTYQSPNGRITKLLWKNKHHLLLSEKYTREDAHLPGMCQSLKARENGEHNRLLWGLVAGSPACRLSWLMKFRGLAAKAAVWVLSTF